MKTDDLIDLLAQDIAPGWPFRTLFVAAALLAVTLAGMVFFASIGARADIDHAVKTSRFLFKFVVTIPLAVGAVGLAMTMACPGAELGNWRWVLAVSPGLLLGAAALEMGQLPPVAWTANMIGHNANLCLTLIPLLSLGPLICFIGVLRHGAPTRPGMTGAAAGLAAAAIAATFYAANCDDDSPLFVLLWYPLALMMVSAVGYGLGQRYLRW
ncbi:MAG: NrsF family protein [Xanthobacteraceae bacterium]